MLVPAAPFETPMVATGVVFIVLSVTGITAAAVYLAVVIMFMILGGLASCVKRFCVPQIETVGPSSDLADLESPRNAVGSFASIGNVD